MTNASPASASDDVGFELYDLRVEVVGPTDRPIYCGGMLLAILNAALRPTHWA